MLTDEQVIEKYGSHIIVASINFNGEPRLITGFPSREPAAGTFVLVQRRQGGWILWYTPKDFRIGEQIELCKIALQIEDNPMEFFHPPEHTTKCIRKIDNYVILPSVVREMMGYYHAK